MDVTILQDLYTWVDEIPVSRPRKDMKRDFADAVLAAEVVHHYIPSIVELHNYAAANRLDSKISNWATLNRKVFRILKFELGDDVIRSIASSKPWAIEQTLLLLREKINAFTTDGKHKTSERSAPHQHHQSQQHHEQQYKKTPQAIAFQEDGMEEQALLPLGSDRSSSRKPKHISAASQASEEVYHHGASVKRIMHRENKSLNNQQRQQPGKQRHTPNILNVEEQDEISQAEIIETLEAKVKNLEHLLHLKDIRIKDLQTRLERSGLPPSDSARKNANKALTRLAKQ